MGWDWPGLGSGNGVAAFVLSGISVMMIRLVRGKFISGFTKDFSSDPKSGSAFGYLVQPFGNRGMAFSYLVRPFGNRGIDFGYPGMTFGYPGIALANRGMAFGNPGIGFGKRGMALGKLQMARNQWG